MSNRNKVLPNIIIGLIIVIATLVIFFIGFSDKGRETIDYVALCFVLISEIALFGGLILILNCKMTMSKAFIRSGIISTLVIYWGITVLISLLLKSMFQNNLRGFVTIQIIIMCIVAIIIIGLLAVASKVHNINQRNIEKTAWMQNNENIVISLITDEKLIPYKQSLNKLYEAIKYSDKISSDITKDKEINVELIELSNELKKGDITLLSHHDVEEKVNSILSLLKERNALVKESKKGGF
ncbi:hypothetical protein KQI42_04700 [Tissierella sp. MSJ-40]|uniref:Uncharacterized protein n=1 Tax=Tissierella simiarum TaxID=2841534 RepID=A0ABS6E314_9FIRM|nr:hypothetical protein [Tissierella simiarum]MBU5437295.1 hypothetical protein [Tissierella simiarum]